MSDRLHTILCRMDKQQRAGVLLTLARTIKAAGIEHHKSHTWQAELARWRESYTGKPGRRRAGRKRKGE